MGVRLTPRQRSALIRVGKKLHGSMSVAFRNALHKGLIILDEKYRAECEAEEAEEA